MGIEGDSHRPRRYSDLQTVVGWATAISKGGGSDESSQVLSFVFTGNDNPGLFLAGPAIDASGTLSYTPGPNARSEERRVGKESDTGRSANRGGNETGGQ